MRTKSGPRVLTIIIQLNNEAVDSREYLYCFVPDRFRGQFARPINKKPRLVYVVPPYKVNGLEPFSKCSILLNGCRIGRYYKALSHSDSSPGAEFESSNARPPSKIPTVLSPTMPF
jgi:hypothetical protein